MTALLAELKDADQDFEWYPTTDEIIADVARELGSGTESIMDIGAGDGRVLVALAKATGGEPDLYGIERSEVLLNAQPSNIVPVGTDFHAQNLAFLPVDVLFCNPPYSEYEQWFESIVRTAHAKTAYLVVPSRWRESKALKLAIGFRGASTRVVSQRDFAGAERKARAVVDVVSITFPSKSWGETTDPFDLWFDANVADFDAPQDVSDPSAGEDLAKLHKDTTIAEMVESYDAAYALMEANYRKIFTMDRALLKELGVTKEAVCEGVKARMVGLKADYWGLLFGRLDAITNKLTSKTRSKFLDKLTGRTAVAFTARNARAVLIWSIKNANRYYGEQLVEVFRQLSTREGVTLYKSNTAAWEKDRWRYTVRDKTHYALDYRIVVPCWKTFNNQDWGDYEYPGGLSQSVHDLLGDIAVILRNLGFSGPPTDTREIEWEPGQWVDIAGVEDGQPVTLFQAKAHKNGNVHFRFMPEAIRAINIEASRLLKWVRGPGEAADEMGYDPEEVAKRYGTNLILGAGSVLLLALSPTTQCDTCGEVLSPGHPPCPCSIED